MPLHRHVGDVDEQRELPRLHIPDGPTPPELAGRLERSDLILDGSSRLNLATFVTTWMEPEAAALMAETVDKNVIDNDEYPQTAELEMRCVNILADLWHDDSDGHAIRTSTTGSSEAAILGGMALLWRWGARRRAAGKPVDEPNLVTGSTSRSAGRSSAVTGTWSRAWRPWRAIAGISTASRQSSSATRTRSAWSRSSAAPSTGAMSRSPRSPRRSTACRPSAASMYLCTSTRPRAGSSRRSSSRTSSTRSSRSHVRCASTAGRCRPTPLPANLEDVAVLRIVVRNGFDHDMADILQACDRRGPVQAAGATADLAARRASISDAAAGEPRSSGLHQYSSRRRSGKSPGLGVNVSSCW